MAGPGAGGGRRAIAFISLEGPDRSGKSTQAARLADRLAREGHRVCLTREPGGTPLGGHLRSLLLSPGVDPGPRAEALLYAADRAEHVERVIRPALARGEVVVSDRFADSSLVYQGWALGLGWEVVARLNEFATGGLEPDLTLVLLADAPLGPPAVPDRIEARAEEFARRVVQGYRRLCREAAPRCVPVEVAGRSPEEVHRAIWDAVAARLPWLARGGAAGHALP